MKKTFLVKRNALLSSAGVSWGAFALSFVIIALLTRLLMPNVFWFAFTPLMRVANTLAAASHGLIVSFEHTAALAIQNEALMNENTALANENQALVKKLEVLSGTSAVRQNNDTGILAGVAARPPESPYDTLLVAAGSNEGVKTGMEAFGLPTGQTGTGGTPIGVVSVVMNRYSRITLFSAPRMTVNGWVGSANVPLLIHGEGGGAMSASIARSAAIVVADIVYAPGPGMLPIGTVVRVDSDPSSPSVTLRIQPVLNLFSLGWVTLRDTGRVPVSSATSTLP